MKKAAALGVTVVFVILGTMACGSPEDSEGGLAGEVLSEETDPIEGARVVIDGRIEETDSDGAFSFSAVEPGSYTVEVWHDGYEDEEREVEINAGEVTEITVIMAPILVCEDHEMIVEYDGEEICAGACDDHDDCGDDEHCHEEEYCLPGACPPGERQYEHAGETDCRRICGPDGVECGAGEYCASHEEVCLPERGFELAAVYPPPNCDDVPRPGRCDVDPGDFWYGPASMLTELELAESGQCCSDFTDDGEPDNALGKYLEVFETLGFELLPRFNDGIDSAIAAGEFHLILEYEGLYELAEDGEEFWISTLYGASVDGIDAEVDPDSFDDGAHPRSLFSSASIDEIGGQLVLSAENGRIYMPEAFGKHLIFGVDVGEPTLLEEVRLEARAVGSSAVVDDGVILQDGELSGLVGIEEIVEHFNTIASFIECEDCLGVSDGSDAIEGNPSDGYSCTLDDTGSCASDEYLNSHEDFSCYTVPDMCGLIPSVLDDLADVDRNGDGEPDALSFGITFEAAAVRVAGIDE